MRINYIRPNRRYEIMRINGNNYMGIRGFPGGSVSKASACNAGDLGLIPGWEDPLEEEMATHSSFLTGEFANRGFSQATVREVTKLDTMEQTNTFRD